jgi:alkylhydroperoxidase family enzyme
MAGAYIDPPRKIPIYIKLGMYVTKKVTGKDLLVPKLLAWYPKIAVSSAVLEGLIAKGDKDLDERILKLVRVQASLSAACPFCIDMNSFEYEKHGITEAEIESLMDSDGFEGIATFSLREKLAIEYTRRISATPVAVDEEFMAGLKKEFSEREIVILAGTASQVNYWARLIKSLGVPPAGFSDTCRIDGD